MIDRKITGEESIFYRTPEANVSLVARIRGEVSESKLKSALEKIMEIHPLLDVHVLEDANHDIWFESNKVANISFGVKQRISDEQWKEAIQEECRVPFDFERGPLIRYILLKSHDVSDFIIFCQHMICDGLSLANLINEILTLTEDSSQEYAAEKDTPLPVPENISLNIKTRRLGNFIKKAAVNYIVRRWRKTRIDFDKEDFILLHKSFFETYRYNIISTGFFQDETNQLIENCRQNGVTVNSAISVAFLAGRKKIVADYNNNIQGIGVNIRNRLKNPVDRSDFGCFVSGIGFKFEYLDEHGFWDNVRLYHQKMKDELETYKDLQSLIALSDMDSSLMEALTFARHINYNPGKFDDHDKLSVLSKNNKHIATKLAKQGLSEYPGLLITNLGALKMPSVYGSLSVEKIFFGPSSIPLRMEDLSSVQFHSMKN